MINQRPTYPTDSSQHADVDVEPGATAPKKIAIAMQTAIPRPPVEVLVHNLIHDIESLATQNAHPLQVSMAAGQISSQVDYILDRVPPRGRFVDHDTSGVKLTIVTMCIGGGQGAAALFEIA
jgi:hypothetical protein